MLMKSTRLHFSSMFPCLLFFGYSLTISNFLNAYPSTGTVSIVGDLEIGSTLSVSHDLADLDGMGAISYNWTWNGNPVGMNHLGNGWHQKIHGMSQPRYATVSPDGKHLYVVSANALHSFDINASTGAVSPLFKLKDGSGGVDGLAGANCIVFSDDGNFAYVTGETDDSISWFSRNSDTGFLSYEGSIYDPEADGLDSPQRVILSPDNQYAYVTADGDHSVSWFSRNSSTGELTYTATLKDGAGGGSGLSGAKGITISSNGLFAYVVGHSDHSVSWFSRIPATGALSFEGLIRDVEDSGTVDGLSFPVDVILSANEDFIFVSSLQDDSVSWFSRDSGTGGLTYQGMVKDGLSGSEGLDGAYGLNISSDGNLLYVAGHYENSVAWYQCDPSTGALTYGGVLRDDYGGVDGLEGAQMVTISPDGNFVYVTGKYDDSVSWYEKNASTGALSYRGIAKNGDGGVKGLLGTNHVIVSSDGGHAYVTGSLDNAVSWYSINSVGRFSFLGYLKDGENGVDGLSSAKDILLSDDGLFAYVSAPGDKAISWYERNASSGDLTFIGMLKDGENGVDGMSDPHNLTFSNDGSHIYVSGRTDNAISWYERNASTGVITFGGVVKDGENGVDGLTQPLDSVISSDGRYLYVAGNDDHSISWFDRNQTTGALSFGGILKNGDNGGQVDGLLGAVSVALSENDMHLYVTGEVSDAVSWYDRDSATGALTFGGVIKDGVGGVDGLDGARDIVLSSDGKYAYVTGWNDNALSWYTRDSQSGALTYVGVKKDEVEGITGMGGAHRLAISEISSSVFVTANTDQKVNFFSLDPNTGAVLFDEGKSPTYTLTAADSRKTMKVSLSYTDGAGNQESKQSAGFIVLNSVPTNLTPIGALSIDENQPIGTVVGHFSADDADGDELSFAMGDSTGTHNGYFSMDANGTLRTTEPLDYEVYSISELSVSVKAMDAYGGSVNGLFNNITFNNVNEPPSGEVTISGNAELGETLELSMYMSDPDGSGNITNFKWYEYNPSFTVGAEYTGSSLKNGSKITLGEAHVDMRLVAVMTYSDGVFSGNKMLSSPTDVINGPPTDLNSSSPLILPENSSAAVIGQMIATDPNGDPVTYSLISGIGDTHNHLFDLESNGTLSILGSIDYETHSSLAIRVRASDDKGESTEQELLITVTNIDESPVGGVSITGTPEVGQTLVASNTLTDPDGMGSVTYDWSLNGSFHLTASSLALDQSMAGKVVTVDAKYTDGGGFIEQVTSSPTVPVNSPPSALATGVGFQLNENNVPGAEAGHLGAVDLDGDTLTYALVSGSGDDNNSIFELDSSGNLKILTALDREVWPSLSIRVRADDGRGGVVESPIIINVGNVVEDLDGDGIEDYFDEDDDGDGFSDLIELAYPSDPMDSQSLATQYPHDLEALNEISIIAGQPEGTMVGRFSAKEPDGEEIIFSLVGDTDLGVVKISSDGDLMVGSNSSMIETGVVKIQVRASDPWGASVEKEFELIGFANPSEAISGYLELEESVAVGTAVGSFAIVDENNESTQVYEQAFVGSSGDDAFEVSAEGLLKVAKPLDYETLSTYYVGVRVTDDEGGIRVQYFGISLINESPAVVDALQPTTLTAQQVTLRGAVIDPGCINGVDQVGFLISTDPIVEFGQEGVSKYEVERDENADSFDFNYDILSGEKIYYRAYCVNVEGVSMSLEETFVPEEVFHPHSIFSATKKGAEGDWWESKWFGEFYGNPENGWIYHFAHGWIFAMPSPTDGVWLWFEDFGWLWTSTDIYPFLYSERKKNWLFIGLQSGQQNLFYDYENNDWLNRAPLTIYPR